MACNEYLGFKPQFAGVICRDPRVPDSIRAQTPLPVRHPQSQAYEDVIRDRAKRSNAHWRRSIVGPGLTHALTIPGSDRLTPDTALNQRLRPARNVASHPARRLRAVRCIARALLPIQAAARTCASRHALRRSARASARSRAPISSRFRASRRAAASQRAAPHSRHRRARRFIIAACASCLFARDDL